jgi:tellurite resistance protein TerC
LLLRSFEMCGRAWRQIGPRSARRVVVALAGATLLLLGLALVFVPGPGLATMALGLAILGAEFEWARRWLRRVKARASELASGSKPGPPGGPGRP